MRCRPSPSARSLVPRWRSTRAIEGASKNILVNAVAPTAGSRLTATALPQEVVDVLKPEYVTPTVVLLCHEDSTVNGRLFEVGGG